MPFLEYVGFPDKLVKLLENSQSGYALTAYAMYKVRYHQWSCVALLPSRTSPLHTPFLQGNLFRKLLQVPDKNNTMGSFLLIYFIFT